jgi:ligand-binding SRPBCC domain-containing protein
MRPVAGRLSGHVTGGDKVRWQGWKWGLPHSHESLIEEFRPPLFFRDRMISGRFATFAHDHHFSVERDGAVLLRDELRFSMPGGALGIFLGKILILPHIRRLMRQRFVLIKKTAEGPAWDQYVA